MSDHPTSSPPQDTPFPPSYTIPPTSPHKSTIIALHGLNSTGETFANRLFLSPLPNTFQPWLSPLHPTHLAHTRLVFPTAPLRTITNPAPVPRTVHAWFEISSFTDLEIEQEIQIPGLRESVDYLEALVGEEIARLEEQGRSARDLFVLGRSQGSSVVGWYVMTRLGREIGGVVLGGSWLVLARALGRVLGEKRGGEYAGDGGDERPVNEAALGFARRMVGGGNVAGDGVLSKVSVLMGHSTDDEWISVELGRQFRDVLRMAGGQVEWNEYFGADEEGHWFKEPEELEAIANFWLKYMRS